MAQRFLVASSVRSDRAQQASEAGGLTQDDVSRIIASVPTLERLIPVRMVRTSASSASGTAEVTVIGTTPDLLSVKPKMGNARIDRGRFLTDADLQSRRNAVVLDTAAARILLPQQDCIGHQIQLAGQPFVIVGELASGNDPGAGRANPRVFVPIGTALGGDGRRDTRIDEIWMEVDETALDATRQVVEAILRKYHADDEFVVKIAAIRQHRPPPGALAKPYLLLFFGAFCVLGFLVVLAGGTVGLVVWVSYSRLNARASTDPQ
jgi:putative ABC transport system permease protein